MGLFPSRFPTKILYVFLFAPCILHALPISYKEQQKVPGLSKKESCSLNLILAAISFKIVSLRIYTVSPSFYACLKSTMEVILLNAVKYHL
jgi:hypothetical protein